MRQKFVLTVWLLITSRVVAQEGYVELTFHPVFGKTEVDTGFISWPGAKDTLKITAFKFYISGIELLCDGKTVWKENNSYHLVDIGRKNSLKLNLHPDKNIHFQQVCFNLGIDSITNFLGALGGDLDPTLGMYWAWQSGYINFKLEGSSNLLPNRIFTFHLGGYASPFNALRNVTIPVKHPYKAEVFVDLEKFLSTVDLKTQNHVMSPGKAGMKLSTTAVSIFKIAVE